MYGVDILKCHHMGWIRSVWVGVHDLIPCGRKPCGTSIYPCKVVGTVSPCFSPHLLILCYLVEDGGIVANRHAPWWFSGFYPLVRLQGS